MTRRSKEDSYSNDNTHRMYDNDSEHYWASGDYDVSHCRFSNSIKHSTLVRDLDNEGAMCVQEQKEYGKPLSLPLDVAVNLKLLKKLKSQNKSKICLPLGIELPGSKFSES